jgi:outer membrane protein OmpA-like peptidoglycan-associated protein
MIPVLNKSRAFSGHFSNRSISFDFILLLPADYLLSLKYIIMRLRLILIILFHSTCIFAQSKSAADTLSATEKEELNKASSHSTFGYYALADSFSKKEDSINASRFFLQVDPYILFFKELTPETIDTFITNRFRLTDVAHKQYVALFAKAWNMPRSAAYKKFSDMAEEDLRLKHEKIDMADTMNVQVQMYMRWYNDSIHSAYLYDYIMKHGWPPLPDGSLYAATLALNDHKHLRDYIPMIKKAVMQGQAGFDDLNRMISATGNQHYYKDLNDYIFSRNYIVFNVNEMLGDKLPASLHQIENAVKAHSPVGLYLVYNSHDIALFNAFLEKMNVDFMGGDSCIIATLFADLADYDVRASQQHSYLMRKGLWDMHWMPSDSDTPDFKLYIVYGGPRTYNLSVVFNQLVTEKKFATHAIHFAVNSSVIERESIDFVKQLATWLKQNPAIRLEIDGHTDSDGDSYRNIKLSLERAGAVKRALTTEGIPAGRLSTKGYGAIKPIQPNTSAEGKANNRRVEFVRL